MKGGSAMSDIILFAGVAVVLPAVILIATFGLTYHILPDKIVVRVLGLITIYNVCFDQVEDVYFTTKGLGADLPSDLFRTIRLGNSLYRGAISVKKRGGLMRYVFLTPNDPEAFATEVLRRSKKRNVGLTFTKR